MHRGSSPLLCILGVLLTAAACSGGSTNLVTAQQHRAGGTVFLLAETDNFEHLDPQRNYTVVGLNVSRLIYRTLTTYASKAGPSGSELVGDLATDLGRPTDGNRVWEFTLKAGARWEDGQPITCPHLKHGVERSFSPLLDGGPGWARSLLAGGNRYTGPFDGEHLHSITCLDQVTVRFQLSQPVGDFGYVVALPVFSPVRPDKDTRQRYDERPMSNGPYRIAELYTAKTRQIVLERNPHWDRRTDTARMANADRIVLRFGLKLNETTNALIKGEGDYRYAVQIDSRVPPTFLQQVINDPVLSRRAVTGTTAYLRYVAINTRTIRDVKCRQALVHAMNTRRFRAVLGGSHYGDYATTVLPPGMHAHRNFDLYRRREHPEGDRDRALQLIRDAAECPTPIRLDYQDTPTMRRAAQTIVDSFQPVGIEVIENPINRRDFYNIVTVPGRQGDLVLASWLPDWANGSGSIPALFHGRTTRATTASNHNLALLDNPEINQRIDQTIAEPDLARQYRLWGELDERIQREAVSIPLVFERQLQMFGTNVKGAFLHAYYGRIDVVALSVVP